MALRELLNDQAGNARKGRRYRNVKRGGQTVHDYASGPDVTVGGGQALIDHAAANVGHLSDGPMRSAARAPGGGAVATADDGHGHVPAPFRGSKSLAGLLRGVGAYEQQGGTPGSELDSHLHDAGGVAPGANAKGERFAQLEVGGRKFHVYFSGDGQRVVKEIKKRPTFTPTPAP